MITCCYCWYTSDSGDTEDKDWRTQSISAPILSSEAGNWGEKTRRRVGSVQFAPKLCLALVVVNNFDINVHCFHNIWRKILSFLALWHLWIYQQDTMLNKQNNESIWNVDASVQNSPPYPSILHIWSDYEVYLSGICSSYEVNFRYFF